MSKESAGCVTAPRRERDVLDSQEHRARSGAPSAPGHVDYKHPAPLGPTARQPASWMVFSS